MSRMDESNREFVYGMLLVAIGELSLEEPEIAEEILEAVMTWRKRVTSRRRGRVKQSFRI